METKPYDIAKYGLQQVAGQILSTIPTYFLSTRSFILLWEILCMLKQFFHGTGPLQFIKYFYKYYKYSYILNVYFTK